MMVKLRLENKSQRGSFAAPICHNFPDNLQNKQEPDDDKVIMLNIKVVTINAANCFHRILLLGRTGVGKSSLGNQLFGDKMTFAVGHKSTSKTETISWAADHYLGTGQCITIIDTPGTKDTEGRDKKISQP